MHLWQTEDTLYSEDIKNIAGCDEAGAGPLAGPVYGAAVILPRDLEIEGLDDSKKLTAKKRDILYNIIIEKALAYEIYAVSATDIDEINILNARMYAMSQAVKNLSITPDYVLIDGNCDRGFDMPHDMLIGGDGMSANIAAASILAKVSRDRYMEALDEKYPEYSFAKHKGYGTKVHYAAIEEHGECEEHRKTFLRKYYERKAAK